MLEKVFSHMSTADCWKARQVSRSWANVVRQRACFELVISADRLNLCGKVRALFNLQLEERVPHAVVTVRLSRVLDLQQLSTLFQELSQQVCGLLHWQPDFTCLHM